LFCLLCLFCVVLIVVAWMWRGARRAQKSLRSNGSAIAGYNVGHLQETSTGSCRGFFFRRGQPRKLFGIEGLDSPKDFPQLAADAVRSAQQGLDGAAQQRPGELVAALDTASNDLCRIADAAELCRNVHPDQQFVSAANEAVGLIAGYMGEVNFDVDMYNGMVRGESSEECKDLPLETRTVLRHMRVSMEHEGIHLPEVEKEQCLQLQEREQTLSFEIIQQQEQKRGDFSAGQLWLPTDAIKDALAGQTNILSKRTNASGKEECLIPADQMWTEQVLRRVTCAETRKLAFEAQHAFDTEGEEAMAQLRGVRHQLAGIRGYGSWNEYAQREALLSDPSKVAAFLDAAWEQLKPGLVMDLQELAAEKEKLGLGEAILDPWDLPMLLHTWGP